MRTVNSHAFQIVFTDCFLAGGMIYAVSLNFLFSNFQFVFVGCFFGLWNNFCDVSISLSCAVLLFPVPFQWQGVHFMLCGFRDFFLVFVGLYCDLMVSCKHNAQMWLSLLRIKKIGNKLSKLYYVGKQEIRSQHVARWIVLSV